jgi:hypothetical protein
MLLFLGKIVIITSIPGPWHAATMLTPENKLEKRIVLDSKHRCDICWFFNFLIAVNNDFLSVKDLTITIRWPAEFYPAFSVQRGLY